MTVPPARKLRQRDHLQILKGCGIGKNLQVFRLHLFVAPKVGIQVYIGIRTLRWVRGEAFGFVGDGNLNGGDQTVAVRQPHGNGSAVGCGNGDGHIL